MCLLGCGTGLDNSLCYTPYMSVVIWPRCGERWGKVQNTVNNSLWCIKLALKCIVLGA